MAAVTVYSDFEAQEIKFVTLFISSPSICYEEMGPDVIIFFFFFNVEFQAGFFTSLFHPHQEAVSVPLHFLPLQ